MTDRSTAHDEGGKRRRPARTWVVGLIAVLSAGAAMGQVVDLGAVDAKLLRWDTTGARAALEPGFDAENGRHLMLMGQILQQEGKRGAAIDHLRRARNKMPDNADVRLALARALEGWGGTDEEKEAVKAERKAMLEDLVNKMSAKLQATPEDAASLYYSGVARQLLGNYEKAAEQLQKAHNLRPGHALTLYELGLTRVRQKQWQQAFDKLTAAIERNGAIAYAYYYRGGAAGELGRKDLMVNDFDRFLKLAPKAPDAPKAERVVAAARR